MFTEETVRNILREIRDNIASVAGGTQYDEGDTAVTFAGNIAMAEGPSNTATPLQVDASKNLQVDIAADSVGIGGGTQYATNAAYADGNTGTLALTIRDDTLSTLTEADGDYSGLRVNSTGALWVDASAFTVPVSNAGLTELAAAINANELDVNIATDSVGIGGGSSPSGMGDGVTTVTTAGTDVALAGSTACVSVIIQAQTDNTGLIAVGATGVDATEATGTGVILYPGDTIELDITDLSTVYIDSTVNGEGVRYTYFTA